jgi:MFS family permease
MSKDSDSLSGLRSVDSTIAEEAAFSPDTPSQKRVGKGFLASYSFAYIGVWLALLPPTFISLPLKIGSLVPQAEQAGALGLVLAVGSLLAIIANLTFGTMSDRSRSRFGKRRPYLFIGVIIALVGAVLMGLAQSVDVVLVGFIVAQVGGNMTLAALFGVLPDQVPSSQRGMVSGVFGISIPVGLVVGAGIVQTVAPNFLLMFLIPAIVPAIGVTIFLFVLKDQKQDVKDIPAFKLGTFLKGFYISPRKFPDFGWAFWSRFFFLFANGILQGFQAFYLADHLHVPDAQIPQAVFMNTVGFSAFTVISSVIFGKLSDVTKRRKPFVFIAAIVYGAGLFLAASAGTLDAAVVAWCVAGVGLGSYLAVDLALAADILPNPKTPAKDLAVFNIASTLPQMVAPIVAPIILAASLGSYPVLYGAGAVAGLVAAILLLPIKKVR